MQTPATPVLKILQMPAGAASEVSKMIEDVIRDLPYYNQRAQREEIAKYSADLLEAMSTEDADSVIVAKLENALVGFCLSKYDDGLLWLSWFGVISGCRRAGIGGALLRAFEETAPRRRAHKLWCDTRTDNVGSQKLLTAFGFRKIATLTNHWYGQDFFLWEKSLGSGEHS